MVYRLQKALYHVLSVVCLLLPVDEYRVHAQLPRLTFYEKKKAVVIIMPLTKSFTRPCVTVRFMGLLPESSLCCISYGSTAIQLAHLRRAEPHTRPLPNSQDERKTNDPKWTMDQTSSSHPRTLTLPVQQQSCQLLQTFTLVRRHKLSFGGDCFLRGWVIMYAYNSLPVRHIIRT